MLALVQAAKVEVKANVQVEKGGKVSGKVTITIPEGWHAYQNPPASEYENPIKLSSKTKGFTFTKVSYPKGEDYVSSGNKSKVYFSSVVIPFEAKSDSKLQPTKGQYQVKFAVDYQLCSDRSCIPPDTATFEVSWKAAK